MSQSPPTLPPVGELSEPQVRGAACVYCGIHLGSGPATDLGERVAHVADLRIRWFPRACTSHLAT